MQGRNIDITYLSADNNGDRFPTLIDECLSLKPDVIAVTTTPAAHLLKKATRTIPIVMVALGDPLGTGLVDSLSRPSENITGMSLMVPQLAVKRLELLRELTPGISRVLVLSFLADPIAPIQVKAMEEAARSLGMNYFQAMRYIVLPQAIRRVLPPLGNDFIAMLKESSLVSVLGVRDITQLGKLYAASSFQFFGTYNAVAFIYLTMTILLSLGVKALERRLKTDG